MRDIDYWRLSDLLSVTDASMLAAGLDPGEIESTCPPNPEHGSFHERGTSNNSANYFISSKFIAVFRAMRNAILADRLPANLGKIARAAPYHMCGGDAVVEYPGEDEEGISYNVLLKIGGRAFRTNVADNQLGDIQNFLFLREPDWSQTTVSVDDLKSWMKERGFLPPFFFPAGNAEGFRNKEHPRYSPKLACAVAAWEAVTKPQPNISVKATVVKWINTNGVNYGLADKDGILSLSAVEEIAKVVNWDPKGGANPTGGQAEMYDDVDPATVENFRSLQTDTGYFDDDSELPF